ncbi:hypothetical protein ACOME3_001393 [Neoechinorhynchus agilis]
MSYQKSEHRLRSSVELPAVSYPKKKLFKQRAHSNPFSFHSCDNVPSNPSMLCLESMFSSTALLKCKQVSVLDIGCGYGSVLCSLGSHFHQRLCLGMEIRVSVSEFVQQRIASGRDIHGNVWCLRANAMKHLPFYIGKAQLDILVIAFPDPHFKKCNHKRRIVSKEMLPEYAYVMADSGVLYGLVLFVGSKKNHLFLHNYRRI